ncbi:hypothetical protein ACP4OV_009078 [Aristida adscensionis]
MASTDGSKVVGVVIRDFTDGGLTALKWAHEHLKRPDEKGFNYKMSLIQIIQVAEQTPREVPLNEGKPFGWFKIESLIAYDGGNNGGNNELLAKDFQELAEDFKEILSLRRFQGEHVQGTLEFAIKQLSRSGLDMLILGCTAAEADGRCVHSGPGEAAPPAGEATTNDATANDHGNPPVNNNAPTAASPPPVHNTNKASTPHQPKNSSMAK